MAMPFSMSSPRDFLDDGSDGNVFDVGSDGDVLDVESDGDVVDGRGVVEYGCLRGLSDTLTSLNGRVSLSMGT